MALGLATFVGLKLYFTPARIKALIVSYAAANLKREASLDSATLTLRGFAVKNLRISEYPDLKKGEFLSVAEFDIRPDLLALLKKQIKIGSILASGVNLSIVEVATGTYNFSDMLQSQPGAGVAGTSVAAAPPAFSISNITVKNLKLSYLSADKSMAVRLSDTKFTAGNISGADFFPFEAGSKLKVKSPYLSGEFPVSVKGKLDLGGLNPEKGKVIIEAGSLKAGNINAGYSGELEGFQKFSIKLALNVEPFSTSDLKPYLPAVPPRIPVPVIRVSAVFNATTSSAVFKSIEFKSGPAEGNLTGRAAWNPAVDYELQARLKVRSPKMASDVLAVNFPAVPKGYQLPPANIDAVVSLTPEKISITEAKLSAASLQGGIVGDLKRSPLSFIGIARFNVGEMKDMAAIAPFLKQFEPKGKAGADIKISYAKKLALSGKASFNGMGAKFAGCELSSLKGAIDISKNQMKSKGISAKLNGAELKMDLAAQNYLERPKITLNVEQAPVVIPEISISTAAQGGGPVKAAQLAAQEKPLTFDLSGVSKIGGLTYPELNAGESTFKYDLKGISADLTGLSGRASFAVKGGKFDNLCALAEKNKVSKVVLYPMVILAVASRTIKGVKLPDFNTVVFSKMEGDYVFENGVMRLQKSSLDAEAADVNASGSINLATEEIDMRVSVKLKKASGISMSVPLAMKIKGTFAAPEAKVDVKSVLDQPVIKDNLKKLWDGLVKKKK